MKAREEGAKGDGATPTPTAEVLDDVIPPRGGVRIQTFASLRHRDYRLLWGTSLFHGAGMIVQQVTLGWLVYQLSGSAWLLGVLSGLRALPYFVFAPLAGVAADRFDRRRLLILVEVVLAVAALLFALDVATGHVKVWHAMLFGVITGSGFALNQPIRQSIISNVVPRHDLMNAIALNSAALNMTRVVAPLVGGVLIAFLGPALNFTLQGIFYAAIVLLLLPMRIPYREEAAGRGSVGKSLVEGLRYVASQKPLMAQMLISYIPQLLIMPYGTLLPLFAEDILKIGPEGLGLLYAVTGVGALTGTLTIATLGNLPRKGLVVLLAVAIQGVALIAFGWSHWLGVTLVILLMMGISQMVFLATNNTIIQLLAPDAMRGRVLSIYSLNHGMGPAGSLLMGGLTEMVGPAVTFSAVGSGALLLTLAVAVFVPQIRQRA